MARNPHASYESSDHQRMPIIPIVNNLTTTTTGSALDANQGYVLDNKINNNPGLAWKSLLNQTNQISKSALVSLPLGVHIVQVATAPSDFPISNAYGILYHAGSLLNYHWLVFINSGNMFTINCNGTNIGNWQTYTPMTLDTICTTIQIAKTSDTAPISISRSNCLLIANKFVVVNVAFSVSGTIPTNVESSMFYFPNRTFSVSSDLMCTKMISGGATTNNVLIPFLASSSTSRIGLNGGSASQMTSGTSWNLTGVVYL